MRSNTKDRCTVVNDMKKDLMKICDSSMEGIKNSIKKGSYILIDKEKKIDIKELDKKICLFKYKNKILIKQLVIDKNGDIFLKSFNENYKDIKIDDKSDLIHEGTVIKTYIENIW